MDFFFKPNGVALIGASANPLKGGYHILKNLRNSDQDVIYPVNPGYAEIEGLTCYASISEVPDPVDLAIIFIPAERVPQTVVECASRGISGVMIESAGFAESGETGLRLQQQLREIKEKNDIRIWGPNCMGLVDAVHSQVFSFVLPMLWETGLTAGKVSLVVQSGMLAAGFLIDIMTHGIMGISKACSIGNKVDIDECDVLQYLIDDPDTGTIGLYLESIPNGRRFIELCRRSEKPIVVLRGGKSEKGAQAALSHTASLAGNGAVVSGALAQAGVVEAHDFKQMMDLCRTLSIYPELPKRQPGRVAVITMSGAAGIVSADFIDEKGIMMAELSARTQQKLFNVFPQWMPVSNPIDLWPAVEIHGRKKSLGAAFEAVCADPNVDIIFFHSFMVEQVSRENIAYLADMARNAGKPFFIWLMGIRSEVHKFQLIARELEIPAFTELYRAVECMAAVFNRHKKK